MRLAERILDRLFDYREITDGCDAANPGTVYLKRYFLLVSGGTLATRDAGTRYRPPHSLTISRESDGAQLYLHCIKRSDAARELHDHPWSFVAVMLWRGYIEETPRGFARKWPGMVLVRPATWRHRVHIPGKQAWSLVFTSGKKRTWGFWRDGAFIPWRQFIAKKCADRDAKESAGAARVA